MYQVSSLSYLNSCNSFEKINAEIENALPAVTRFYHFFLMQQPIEIGIVVAKKQGRQFLDFRILI